MMRVIWAMLSVMPLRMAGAQATVSPSDVGPILEAVAVATMHAAARQDSSLAARCAQGQTAACQAAAQQTAEPLWRAEPPDSTPVATLARALGFRSGEPLTEVPWCPWAADGATGGSYRVSVKVVLVSEDAARVTVVKTCQNRTSGLNPRYVQSSSFDVRRAQTRWTATRTGLVET